MTRSLERAQSLPPRSKRGIVVLQALVYTPLTLLSLAGVALALVEIASGDYGYAVMLVFSSVLAVILGYQAVHYLRDLSSEPVQSEGEIAKKWHKGNLFFFFMPGYYIAVKGQIYTVSRDHYRTLLEEDMVRIRHYPHSLTVEQVERFDEVEKKFVPAGRDEQPY